LGLLAWAKGFIFEAVGDHQLKVFLQDPANRGQLMTTGLWSYTRHPNYFGEATMWWGIFFLGLAGGAPLLTILSPITITFLLVKVSGVPLLEESMKKKPGYLDYARRTSVFVPWFPKGTK
jgi:steroid 5-alpha reductase family enzyme